MDKRFLLIEDGYGILHKNNNYWAMGWDPKPTDLSKYHKYNPLLLKANLLTTFPQVITSKWFAGVMEILQQYVDENGIYHFPKEFLTEKDSCWILGCHMGLGESRRKKNALELEGTFRAIMLLNKIANSEKKEYVCFNRQLILQELRIGTLVALQEFLVGVGKVDYVQF